MVNAIIKYARIEFGLGAQGKSLGEAYWDAVSHTDAGIVLNPTIKFDGIVFEEKGVYNDENALEF